MKSLFTLISIVATTLAAPKYYQYHGPLAPISHDGTVMDTPEVAHAKTIHLAAVAEAAAKVPHSATSYSENQNYHRSSKPVSVGYQMHHSEHKYYGPPAPLDDEGRVVDTPEVIRAKAAHLAIYNRIASAAPVIDDHSQIYKPPLYNHGYHDDRMIDSPEEAHAGQAHLAAHDRDSYEDY